MHKKISLIIIVAVVLLIGAALIVTQNNSVKNVVTTATQNLNQQDNGGGPEQGVHPLSILSLKEGEYPGSDITIEQTLEPGSNYQRYIASYKSEGLKIYALLTIPNGNPSTGSGQVMPDTGWPVVIFNHGFIPPAQYVTNERYIAYTDAFSRNEYIVFRSDYRGHGNSEGQANSYGSNGYTIDVLNAVAAMKRLIDPSAGSGQVADPNRIGMWGHSMGGHITLRSMVVNKDIKAGVIWAGVVASYPDLISKWRRGNSLSPFPTNSARGGWRQGLIAQYGTPEENPTFWNSISATSYLSDISSPIQLHHGTADHSVPYEFSEKLDQQLKAAGKESELYIYPGDEHDIPNNFGVAMQRSVEFFDRYVKGSK